MSETTRRAMMLGAGGAGLAAVLTACAGYGDPSTQASVAPPADQPLPDPLESAEQGTAAPEQSQPDASAPDQNQPDAGAGGKALASTGDIPAGGGKVFEAEKVVVVQTQGGEFKAFDSTCTHQGCAVASVSNGTIVCPCHGSKFKVEDGSVAAGPATKPLAAKQIKVDGDKIMLA
jgi:Rieske Fe-S protein